MESKYTHIHWAANFKNYDIENFHSNSVKSIFNDFGLVIKGYNNDKIFNDKIPCNPHTYWFEEGDFTFNTLPDIKWCSINLRIPYNEDFDIIKFKNSIKIALKTEEIKDTLDFIYRRENIHTIEEFNQHSG